MADLNTALQPNASAYNPDCTAGKASYARQRAVEMAGKTPDSKQIQATMSKKPGKPMPKRGR